MQSSKQTAVEWLMYNLPSLFVKDSGYYKELFDRAKAIEKEQIQNAYQAGDVDSTNKKHIKEWSEEYYDETYGYQ